MVSEVACAFRPHHQPRTAGRILPSQFSADTPLSLNRSPQFCALDLSNLTVGELQSPVQVPPVGLTAALDLAEPFGRSGTLAPRVGIQGLNIFLSMTTR
jgi:hypothetical protein